MTSSDPTPGRSPAADAAADVALHAFDALETEAARALEARIDGDRALEAELEAGRATAGELGMLAPAVEPPADLLPRILLRVRGQGPRGSATPFAAVIQDARPADPDALSFLARDEGAFVPLRVAGISARTLHRDDAAGYATVLVRMQPGASYPAHRHGDDEECYVLEGDLQVGATTMRAGDYQVAGRGSVHPMQTTHGGCLLLLRSSLHDELVEST